MAILRGDQFVLQVRLADTNLATVNDLNSLSLGSERDVSNFPVFNRSTPHKIKGARDKSFDVGGLFSPGDPGQDRLRAIEAADGTVLIRVLWDGANGFEQLVSVASYTYDVEPESPQEYGFTLSPEGTATIVGAGPLL